MNEIVESRKAMAIGRAGLPSLPSSPGVGGSTRRRVTVARVLEDAGRRRSGLDSSLKTC
ncbi:MAG: hypothetical protein AAGF23_20825 [Acidobacteriota bacterium]